MKLITEISLIRIIVIMTVRLVNDVYPLIYQWLDPPSQVMMALACKRFLKLGVHPMTRGILLYHYALSYEYFDVIKWARERRFPWDPEPCINLAVIRGNLSFLQWARKRGYRFNTSTCALASEYGQLETLKWLRENDVSWSASTCSNAAKNGHLPIIQWARSQGCDWTVWTIM